MSVAALSGVSMRARFIMLVAGTLVVVLGWFMVGYRPTSSRLSAVKADVETTQAEVAALEAKLAHLQELRRNEAELREQQARFVSALPTAPAVSDFLVQVQDAADQAGIGFLSIAPSLPAPGGQAAPAAGADGTAPPPAFQVISVQLTANGGFFALEDFVERMEHLARAVTIKSFQLSGGEGGLSLSMSLQMFTQPAIQPAAPAAPAPAPAEGA